MNKTINFAKRNFKEMLRDPVIYVFCLVFPLVMLALFQIINRYTNGNTPMFSITAIFPSIMMFSFSFVTLLMALLVSKDKQTSFLKRLFTSPMKSYEFVLGYAITGIVIGILQSVITTIVSFIISLITKVEFTSFLGCLLVILSQMPVLFISVFLGILFGVLFNDKSAPGICSILISASGVLGGCWMPIETMQGFETFCRFLPFYPSVYLGKIFSGATNFFGDGYAFNQTALLGLLIIAIYSILSVLLCFISFCKKTKDN